MRKTLTDRGVKALRPRKTRYAFPDPELAGHYVRVTPQGGRSYAAVARSHGRQIWTTIGTADTMTIKAAREQARVILQRVRAGLPAVEAKGETFAEVADNWTKRHVDAQGLRSAREIKRLLKAHVLPRWGNREFISIRKSDVAALLDAVEDAHTPRQADMVLMVVRALMNWAASRRDDYVSPCARMVRRQSVHAMARSRVLSDEELRAVWKAAETSGPFGGVVRLCLLTGQRRSKILRMQWDEFVGDEWTIPKAAREKDNAGRLVLPEMALAIINAQPRLASNPFVFRGRDDGPIRGMFYFKDRLDKASGVTGWRLHDLRRTARSLMSRAGVEADVGERCLGHAIPGIRGVYDRFEYKAEKADALQRLANLIDSIVHPRANVLPMPKRSKKRRHQRHLPPLGPPSHKGRWRRNLLPTDL